jgi:hypothetical protein
MTRGKPAEASRHFVPNLQLGTPSAVRGAKQLINRISNAGAAEHFAAEREIIFTLIGKPHQVEAITANFENRLAKFEDVG